MSVNITAKEWIKIVVTILIFASLGVAFAEVTLSILSGSFPYGWVFILANYLLFMMSAVGFHLYALKNEVYSLDAYVGSGILLGIIFSFLLFFPLRHETISLGFLSIMTLFCGGISGFIYSYSFWTFIVNKTKKHKAVVLLTWVGWLFPYGVLLKLI